MKFQVSAVNGDGGTIFCQTGWFLFAFVFCWVFFSARISAFGMLRY